MLDRLANFLNRAHAGNLTKLFPMTSLREIQLRPGDEAMIESARIRGVLAPVVTPFKSDLAPDKERFIAHCKWLLSQNCGLAVFGTNSEANSLSIDVLNAVGPAPRFISRDALS
jgi:hypothetical protein